MAEASSPAELYVRFRNPDLSNSLATLPDEGQLAPSCCPFEGATAAFLDRDGVVNNDGTYVNAPEAFELLPGVGDAIRRLNEAGVPVVVITNQGGLALDYLGIDDLDAIHGEMDRQLSEPGAHVDAVYAALAHRDGKRRELRRDSRYRKPAAGMLFQAADDLGLDLSRSVVVGDTTTDIAAGHEAGCRAILVRTGFAGLDARSKATPDEIVDDLPAAVDLILKPGNIR